MKRSIVTPSSWLNSLSGVRAYAFFDVLDPLPWLWESINLPRRLLS